MRDPVEKSEFWKQRLEEAEAKGMDFHSVYNTSPQDWEYIAAVHKKICDYFCAGKVLDVGCGYGRMADWFNDYTGIDITPEFIRKARKQYPNKEFYTGDIKDMPFGDKEFDWAIVCSIKRMIEREVGDVEWLKMEKEIKRVAKNVLILEYSSPEKYETIFQEGESD